MGSGFRAFVVTLLGFVVFGAALAAWHGGDEEAAESVGAGGASGGPGESAADFNDAGPGEPLANATEGRTDANESSGNATS